MIKLSLTYESTTLDFQAAGCVVLDGFYPVTATSEENVVETFDILIIGSSTELINWVRSINQAFDYARRRYDDNYPVYLNFALNQTLDAWRTRVVDGAILLNSKLDPNFRAGRLKATITIERLAWWEGPEAQIPLTNANGTNNTTGLAIKNCGDMSAFPGVDRDNTVSIAAASVTGDLPAATRLEITNTYDNSNRNYTWWIGHNAYSDPANFPHVIEAESSKISGTSVPHASYSAGAAYSVVVYNQNLLSGYSITYLWDLPTAMLNSSRGNYVRAMARFAGNYSATTLWVKLQIVFGVTVVWDGPLVKLNGQTIQEIASFRLPPYLLRAGDLYPMELRLIALDTTTPGTQTITLDSLELLPLDSWRKLEPAGYGQGYQVRIVDDGLDGVLYTDGWSPAGKTGHYIGYGESIKLVPGKDQKLYFMWNNTSFSAISDLTADVKLFYRPRRFTI